MEKQKTKKRGFTLIEIVLVLTIMTISVGLSVLYYQSSQVRADVNSQVSEFVAHIRLTQSNASSGLENSSHGIHLENSDYTVFKGGIYLPAEESNFKVELPPTIKIENINLNGGGSDIIFNSPDGDTNTHGTLDFTASQINKTVTITISSIGTVNY